MLSIFKRLTGDENAAALKRAEPIVAAVRALEDEYKALSDEDLRAKTDEFKERLIKGETLDEIAPEAFAAVVEAADRTTGMRHFDVQLIGGMILHNGDIAEMKTGEGKTLVATLPVYLNALEGKGAHLVTVNDYLSRLHAVLMGQVYAFLGMSVGVINHEQSFLYKQTTQGSDEDKERDEKGAFKVEDDFLESCTRREAYAADITYGTNNEFGFDYLRDNIEQDPEKLRQRKYHFAIVDEIDSILIDEARTPLIISAPMADAESMYDQFTKIARDMEPGRDFEVDEKRRAIEMTDAGIEKAEAALGVENIYTDAGIKYVHHLQTAIRAKTLFGRDKDYVVQNGEVIIVDELTGRLQPGRRWSEGLHQAIESKEGVAIQQESRTFASITFQNYFRGFEKLSGMTGTAKTNSEEFYKVYGLNTVEVPTNMPNARVDRDDLIFQTEKGKFQAIAKKVKELNEKGQPVLVGTASVEKNELLSAHFKQAGIPHEVLNAKNHDREGEIIANGGRRVAVTIATNMAGRGVDIKLGGAEANKEEYEEVKALGGLYVLGTERHEARRIDNQLRGRSGRQGDPGETQFFVSLEDSLMRIFATDMVKRVMGTFNIPEDEPIQQKMISRSLETAQTKIEEFNFDARKSVLSYDDVLNVQRKSIYERRRKVLTGGDDAIDEELLRIAGENSGFEDVVKLKKKEFDEKTFHQGVRFLMLQTIDMLWVDHLETMDYLRSSVNLRAYGQRDPLVEYKKEGLMLFRVLEESYISNIIEMLPNMRESGFARNEAPKEMREVHENARVIGQGDGSGGVAPLAHGRKFGRNEIVAITNGSETKEMKFKKAESLLATGEWRIMERQTKLGA